MTALLVGAVLALAALAFVLYPLFRDAPPAPLAAPPSPASAQARESASARAVAALREIEFDRETGKLSDSDYAALKAAYTGEALAALRVEDASLAATRDDEAEALIRAHRARGLACTSCGPRPEPDAIYCSQCGRYLAGACGSCGNPVTEAGARYCGTCGTALAA